MNIKKTGLFWAFYILATLSLLLGLVVAPVWSKTEMPFKDWGSNIVSILVGIIIILYIIFYLFRQLRDRSSAIKVLTIIEIVIMAIIAAGSIIAQFRIINIVEPCKILGVALWLRGSIGVFRAYYHRAGTSQRYSIIQVVISLVLVTAGTYLFASPIFTERHVQWILAVILFVVCGFLVYVAIAAKPEKIGKRR